MKRVTGSWYNECDSCNKKKRVTLFRTGELIKREKRDGEGVEIKGDAEVGACTV
jgi:hypothetical protein